MTYHCPGYWTVQGSADRTYFDPKDREIISSLSVNTDTCELEKPENMTQSTFDTHLEELQKNKDEMVWSRVTLTILSMMVSASIFSGFNITTFYSGITLVVGGSLRKALIFFLYAAFTMEITTPDSIIKLIEGIYMKRHEMDLIGEEELYRMLQEIVRQPELIKCLTGSSLRGDMDPQLDKVGPEVRKKLKHLQMLEQKGFDVTQNREKLLTKGDLDDIKI